jgi:hypothetical protein
MASGADGAVYVGGSTQGSLDGKTNSGFEDAFITKFNSDGTAQWTQLLGTSAWDSATALTISTIDSIDSIYVSGYTGGSLDGQTNSGQVDAYLAKFDSDGNWVWTQLLGSDAEDRATAVAAAADGSVYVSGYTTGNVDGQTNSGDSDAFVTRFESDGNKAWTRLLGTGTSDQANAVTTGADSSVYISGFTDRSLEGQGSPDGLDAFMAKFSVDGTKEWTKVLGSGTSNVANALSTAADGSIYVSGVTYGTLDGQTNRGNGDIFVSKYTV